MMSKKNIFIIWSWWHANVVIDIIENNNEYNIEWVIDFYTKEKYFLWYTIISNWDTLKNIFDWRNDIHVFIAIWENNIREKEYLNLVSKYNNILFPNTIHNSAIISEKAHLWKWIFIWPWVVINTNSTIWNFSLINTKVSIDHDSIISDFSSIWPWVTLGWWVKIWNYSHIWLWANILEKIHIWENSLVWAWSLINKNIDNNLVIYWVPWKVIKERKIGEKIYK